MIWEVKVFGRWWKVPEYIYNYCQKNLTRKWVESIRVDTAENKEPNHGKSQNEDRQEQQL